MSAKAHRTFNLRRFERRYANVLSVLLWSGGLASRSQIAALLQSDAKAATVCARLIEYGVARRVQFGWRRRFLLGLKPTVIAPYELAYGAGKSPIIASRWTPRAIRLGLSRFEYYLRFRTLLQPPTRLEAAFRAAYKPRLAKLRTEIDRLKAAPRSAETRQRLRALLECQPSKDLIPLVAGLLPSVGLFIRAEKGPKSLALVFFDARHGPRKYTPLIADFRKAQRQLQPFVSLTLEICADSPIAQVGISNLLGRLAGVSITDLGTARFTLAPVEMPDLFTADELRRYVRVVAKS